MLFSLLINFTQFRRARGVGKVKLFRYGMPFYSELYVSVAFELTSNLLSYFRNVITFFIFSAITSLLLTEREGRTGEYWPRVVTVRTEHREVRTKMTEDQYSPVRLE